jgi:hypothetical protein
MEKLAMDSSPSQLSFDETFVWESYIRLKVTFPDHYTAADLSASIDEVLKKFEDFWRSKFCFLLEDYGNSLIGYRFEIWTWSGRRWRWRWRENVAHAAC